MKRLCVLLALLALALPLQAQEKETLAADAPRTTAGGATFTAPAGWSITRKGNLLLLSAPEGDSWVALFESEAKDADAAVDAAWEAYGKDRKRPLRLATPQPNRNGWTDRRAFSYETSPNERAGVSASAQRAGATWLVTIADGKDATFEKRSSQLGLVFSSTRPMGYARENFAARKAHPLDEKRIGEIKAFLEDGMKKLGVPGIGLALLDKGKVVFEGGLGVRELGKPEPVDADTLFLAASNTKGLTTLLIAELVDDGKLRWDQRVTEVYPNFRLGDAETTRQVQVKHLICACTGMPRQDMEWLWQRRDAPAASTMKLLSGMQPTSKFGDLFQYSNVMAGAAGLIGGAILYPGKEIGAAYDEAMAKRVFEPLGMTRTTFEFPSGPGNWARPHGQDMYGSLKLARGELNYTVIPARPAGGVWTSAHDLARYVQMELARGKLPNGKTLVSEENLLARRAPQVLMSEDLTYGMGLMVHRQWGIPIVMHGGDLLGYHSNMLWLPEHGVGAVILTNSDPGGALRSSFTRKLVEVLFDGKPEADDQVATAAKNIQASLAKFRERIVTPPDAAEAGKLATRYTSAELGDVTVRRRDGGVVFEVGEWSSTVGSRKNDDGSISFITLDPGVRGFEWVVGERAGRHALILRDAQHEYVFTEARS